MRRSDARPWSGPIASTNGTLRWVGIGATQNIGCVVMRRATPASQLATSTGMPESVPATVGARRHQCGPLRPWASKTENTEIPDAATYQILTGSRRLPLPAPTSRLAAIAIDRAWRAEDCDIRDIGTRPSCLAERA